MSKENESAMRPEWSHWVEADKIPDKGQFVKITAPEAEAGDLARRLGVEALDDLRADVRIEREKSGLLHVAGVVRGRVIQSCVVTGDPVATAIEEEFDGWYADEESPVSLNKIRHNRMAQKADIEIQLLDEKDDPEALVNGKIDIGELAAQYLSLAVPAYPHKDGVMHDVTTDEVPLNKKAARPNPFAALKDWRQGEKDEK